MQINVKNLKSQSSLTTPHHSFNITIVHIFVGIFSPVINIYKYFFIKLKIYICLFNIYRNKISLLRFTFFMIGVFT